MNVPVEINFRNVEKEDWIKELIRNRAAKLESVAPNLSSCRVAVEQLQKHQTHGRPYRVRVLLTVPPGREITIVKDESRGELHESLQDIIESAFKSAKQKLNKLHDKQKGKQKYHPLENVTAFVKKIFKQKDYGILKALDGHEIYFHRNSVLDDNFDKLREDSGVLYIEEPGEKGMQAVSVRLVETPHL